MLCKILLEVLVINENTGSSLTSSHGFESDQQSGCFEISAPPKFCSAPRPSRGRRFLAPRAPSAPVPLPTLRSTSARENRYWQLGC